MIFPRKDCESVVSPYPVPLRSRPRPDSTFVAQFRTRVVVRLEGLGATTPERVGLSLRSPPPSHELVGSTP